MWISISIVFCIIPSLFSLSNLLFVILGQQSEYETRWSQRLAESLTWQSYQLFHQGNPQRDFSDGEKPVFMYFNGSQSPKEWQILTLSERLLQDHVDKEWFVFLEPYSSVRIPRLSKFLESQDSSAPVFLGHSVRDRKMSITHHYYGFTDMGKSWFMYPEPSAGIVLSRALLERIYDKLKDGKAGLSMFAIDATHELSKFIHETLNVQLSSYENAFCLNGDKDCCAVYFDEPQYECDEEMKTVPSDVKVYVKTWSENHQSRLPYITKTWAPSFPSTEFISDVASEDPPTKSLGVENTKRGHCGKTFAILEKFNEEDSQQYKWLLIADDDTLINSEALMGPLSCHESDDTLIIGERYGFGVSLTGQGSYNYPTGGAGMVFTRTAVKKLIENCFCPKNDSPDDMVIGMCSKALDIPIIHNAAFHQAQPMDYPEETISKIRPISFHKFNDIDPLYVYQNSLLARRFPRRESYVEPQHHDLPFDWTTVSASEWVKYLLSQKNEASRNEL